MTVQDAIDEAIADPAVIAITCATAWRPGWWGRLRGETERRTLDYWRQIREPTSEQIRTALAQRYIVVDERGELLRVEETRSTRAATEHRVIWARS